jgi:hypothetical protein
LIDTSTPLGIVIGLLPTLDMVISRLLYHA